MPLEILGLAEPQLDEPRLEILGRVDEPAPLASLTPSIAGPLIDSPRQKRRKQIDEFNADTNPVSSSEFGRGVSKGFLQVGLSAAGFGEALAQIVGADEAKAWLKEKGDKLEEYNKAIPQAVESFAEIESPGDVGAYALMAVGQLAPQIALGLGAGLAARGAATGAAATTRLAAGAFATTYPQEAGGIYRGIREETGKEAPLTALAFGAPAAALDALPQARLLGKIFGGAAGEQAKREGWKALVRESFKESLKTGGIELGTEVSQEGIAVLANKFSDETYPLLTEKNAVRLIDAGLMGLIGGALLGGTVGLVEAPPALSASGDVGNPERERALSAAKINASTTKVEPTTVDQLSASSTVNPASIESRDVRDRVVLSLLQNDEVFNSVVSSVPVDVVDMLIGEKGSTEKALHNHSVLSESLAANKNEGVSRRFMDYAGDILAAYGAKLSDSKEGLSDLERDTAIPARSIDKGVIMGLVALDNLREGSPQAGARAKLGGGRAPGRNIPAVLDPALLTKLFEEHAAILNRSGTQSSGINGPAEPNTPAPVIDQGQILGSAPRKIPPVTPAQQAQYEAEFGKAAVKPKTRIEQLQEAIGELKQTEDQARTRIHTLTSEVESELAAKHPAFFRKGKLLDSAPDDFYGIVDRSSFGPEVEGNPTLETSLSRFARDGVEPELEKYLGRDRSEFHSKRFAAERDIIGNARTETQKLSYALHDLSSVPQRIPANAQVDLTALFQRSTPVEGSPLRRALYQGEEFLFNPEGQPAIRQPGTPRMTANSVEMALALLADPEVGIDRNVARAMSSLLSTPGIQKAADALGFRLDLVGATSGLLSGEGAFDPVTNTVLVAYNATNPLTGPHEVAHYLERLLTGKQRALVRSERTAALAAALKRKNLTPQQREFLERISAQERTSKWFGDAMEELGTSILEFYPLTNGSEYFAQSFSSWFLNKNNATPGYRSFMAQVKEFLSAIYDALRRAFGAQWNLEEIHRRLIAGDFDVTFDGGVILKGRDILGSMPQFFKNRDAADDAMTRRPLSLEALAEAQRLADVQGGIVPAATLARINALPARRDTPEGYAKKELAFVVDMADISDTPRSAGSLPRNTEEEKRQAVVASHQMLEHDNVIRGRLITYTSEVEEKNNQLTDYMAKNAATAQTQNLKAAFLDRTTERLLRDFKAHVENMAEASAASQNFDAAADAQIRRLADSVNSYTRHPGGLSQAIEKIADAVPHSLFTQPGLTSQDVVNWLNQPTQLPLLNSLGQANWQFLLGSSLNPATSALAHYPALIQKLATIRYIKQDRAQAQADIAAFRAYFATLHAGGRHATPGSVAKAYHKFATASARATEIATGIEDEIDKLDREVRGSLLSVEILNEMVTTPGYVSNLTLANQDVDPIITDIMASGGTGFHTYKGPISGTQYRVDLMPGRAQEQENLQQLAAFLAEIDTYLAPPIGMGPNVPTQDPVLAESYRRISTYLKHHQMNPWFSPENSGLRRWWKVGPFRLPVGLFTGLPKAFFRVIGIPATSAQTLLERIGGREGSNAAKEWQQGDYVLTQLRVVNEDKDHGIFAINLKALAAAVSHGFQASPFGIQQWQNYIADPVIASRQNSLGLPLGPGKKTYGYVVNVKDMEAIAVMKKWEDETIAIVQKNPRGHTLQAFNPIRSGGAFSGDKAGTRLSVAHGPGVMARRFSNFGRGWVRAWSEATTDAQKLKLLENDHNFKMVAIGMVRELNPEYTGQSKDQTQAEVYRLLGIDMHQNNTEFADIDQLLWRIAEMRYQALSPHTNTSLAHERQVAQDTLIEDISGFTKSFNAQVEADEPWTKNTSTPPTIQEITSGANSFTKPRASLVAPSTFYQYGIASDADKALYQHQARQVFQLRQIEAMEQLLSVLKAKQAELRERVAVLQRGGDSSWKANREVNRQTRAEFDAGDFMADWSDLNEIVKDLHATLDNTRRVAMQTADKYYSQTLGFVMSMQQVLASNLLSTASPIWNNLTGATMVSTGLVDAQLGKWNPIFLAGRTLRRGGRAAKVALGQLASIKNRGVIRALRRHGPAFSSIADLIDDFVQLHADNKVAATRIGATAPYQLKQRWKLQSVFKGTGGRVEFADPNMAFKMLDGFLSWPGIRHGVELIKYTMPRITDQLANTANVSEIDRWMESLKDVAIKAWSAREATGSANWRDTTTKAGALSPKELGLTRHGDAKRYRDFFSPVGQIEVITQRYYMAKKADPNAEILTDGEKDALTLEYLKTTNLAVDSNRPASLRGGQIRQFFGLFRGWPSEMLNQIDKLFLQHKGDEGGKEWAYAIASVIVFMLMAALVGAFNREFIYEVKEAWTGETAKDLRFTGLVESGDVKELLRYTVLAWAGTLPYISEVANRALGGTSARPLTDLTAIVPVVGLAQGAFDAAERILVTGDPIYPMVDFVRRWVPITQPILNRLPGIEGDIASRNATRALQSAVPSGMEIREQGGGRFRGTAMTPILRDIVSAAYTGNDAQMREAIARGMAMKEAEGALDPASELAANLRGYMPERRLFGRDLTATEEARLIARMTERQQSHYEQSRQAFSEIDRTLEGLKTGVRAQRPATASSRSSRSRSSSSRRGRLGLGSSRLGRRARIGSRRRRSRLRL